MSITKRQARSLFLLFATGLVALSVFLLGMGLDEEGARTASLAVGMMVGFGFYEFFIFDSELRRSKDDADDGGAA